MTPRSNPAGFFLVLFAVYFPSGPLVLLNPILSGSSSDESCIRRAYRSLHSFQLLVSLPPSMMNKPATLAATFWHSAFRRVAQTILLVPARHDRNNNEGFYEKYYQSQHLVGGVCELCTEFGNKNSPSTMCIGSDEFHPFLPLYIGVSPSTGYTTPPTRPMYATRACGVAPLPYQIDSNLSARAVSPFSPHLRLISLTPSVTPTFVISRRP